jgi:hypothetical protein
MYLNWSDVNFELRTVRVTAKPNLGLYPKRWEDREVPAPKVRSPREARSSRKADQQ